VREVEGLGLVSLEVGGVGVNQGGELVEFYSDRNGFSS